MKWYGPTQFALFRTIFGFYLCVHHYQLISDGTEVFSNQGVIQNSTLLPGYGKLPLHIYYWDSQHQITAFLCTQLLASLCFMVGFYRRSCSLYLFYGWVCLLNRNPLISNPSLGYIGWILLSCSLIPPGERMGFLLTPQQRKNAQKKEKWEVSDILFYGSWAVMGCTYTASGLHKLQCSTWRDGTALYYVLTGPLVRSYNPIVPILLDNMWMIQLGTWGSLFLEVTFLFFGTFYRTRLLYWLLSIGLHVGILSTVCFADLTLGMILAHLFTFDASWFCVTRRFAQTYDGVERDEYSEETSDFNKKPLVHALKEEVVGKSKKNRTSKKGTTTPFTQQTDTATILGYFRRGGATRSAGDKNNNNNQGTPPYTACGTHAYMGV
eukprot:PhF_6_TR27181/c0_g1_i3/m.39880